MRAAAVRGTFVDVSEPLDCLQALAGPIHGPYSFCFLLNALYIFKCFKISSYAPP